MTAADAADFLVEIGTEELPPKVLPELIEAFERELLGGLERARLAHAGARAYGTPRRLAVLVHNLARRLAARAQELKGPPVAVAFDEAGRPRQAALAFARKCGVEVSTLQRSASDKGEWLVHRAVEPGREAAALLPGIVQDALERLPVPRRMRWGSGEVEFVRPLAWVLMLHGEATVAGTVLGVASGNTTRGHRFQGTADAEGAQEDAGQRLKRGDARPRELPVKAPGDYSRLLEQDGCVIADFAERRRRVAHGVAEAAAAAGGSPVAEEALYDEVAALTEWPVPLTGSFDAAYLELPREVIVATLTSHQRCFPIASPTGELLPRFVVVANVASRQPDLVRRGNERVIRPRLADAAFFWAHDREAPLAAREAGLAEVVYQRGLGSMADKSGRVAGLAAALARELGADVATVERAARLAKCDLLTGMVGEFPELQGTMGRYYAEASGESPAVAVAIGEQYLPRYANDALPETGPGMLLALADKLDTLAGAFALGRKPSGNRDPYGLRRAALGMLRIGIERELDFDLAAAVARALAGQPVTVPDAAATRAELTEFLMERLRSWYAERGVAAPVFDAVRARAPATLPDFDARLAAVQAFVGMEQAASLAAANKRIANILRQAGAPPPRPVETALLSQAEENVLHEALERARGEVEPLVARREYRQALARLAELKDPVDRFFDAVMVMTEDPARRSNRLALLGSLAALFLAVADISRLSAG